MQTIVYHSKARKTMCGMGTFCLIGMISFQLTMQNSETQLKVDFQPGYTPFALRYDIKYPNVLYVFNKNTGELYYAQLTKNA